MKRPERLKKALGIYSAALRSSGDGMKALTLADNWLMTQGLAYSSRHDYLETIQMMYSVQEAQEQNKNDSDKSTKTVLERATPASLASAIKESKQIDSGKD